MRISDWSSDVCSSDLDLRDTVARVPSMSILMGEVAHNTDAALDANWRIDGELGLSALRTDIAALMRPPGIDAQVRLDFHNGSNDNWYVTEFGNSLDRKSKRLKSSH